MHVGLYYIDIKVLSLCLKNGFGLFKQIGVNNKSRIDYGLIILVSHEERLPCSQRFVQKGRVADWQAS